MFSHKLLLTLEQLNIENYQIENLIILKKNWNDCLVLENEASAEAIVRLHKYIKITDTPLQITLLLNDIINNPQKYPL